LTASYEDPRPFVAFPPAEVQRRLTVLFRLLLAIPVSLWLAIVGIAAGLGAIVGWFVALVVGRLPLGLAGLLAGYVELELRVTGYLTFVSDEYPSFSLHPTPSPAGFAFVVTPTRLNRLAVLFRIVLVFPKSVLSALVSQGLRLFSVLSWLVTLTTGRLPLPLHNATCAVLRYRVRTNAYLLMLTPEYPRDLFGDGEPQRSDYGLPSSSGDLLVLSGGEKALIVLFAVLGIVGLRLFRVSPWISPLLP